MQPNALPPFVGGRAVGSMEAPLRTITLKASASGSQPGTQVTELESTPGEGSTACSPCARGRRRSARRVEEQSGESSVTVGATRVSPASTCGGPAAEGTPKAPSIRADGRPPGRRHLEQRVNNE